MCKIVTALMRGHGAERASLRGLRGMGRVWLLPWKRESFGIIQAWGTLESDRLGFKSQSPTCQLSDLEQVPSVL